MPAEKNIPLIRIGRVRGFSARAVLAGKKLTKERAWLVNNVPAGKAAFSLRLSSALLLAERTSERSTSSRVTARRVTGKKSVAFCL